MNIESTKNPLWEPLYDELRELLEAKRWQDADATTYFLMLQIMGQPGTDIKWEDIRNFPCTELHRIDRLWVQESDGRFGFSVQRRILQELAETGAGNTSAFREHVGWPSEPSHPYVRSTRRAQGWHAGYFPNRRAATFFVEFDREMGWSAHHLPWQSVRKHGFEFKPMMVLTSACKFSSTSDTVPDLLRKITDSDETMRSGAAYALGEMDVEPADEPPVVLALLKALDDVDIQVRRSVIKALGKIGPEFVAPRLRKFLDDPDYAVRHVTVEALGRLRSDAGTVISKDEV